ncbi:MAG: hypothetical protein VX723_01215 [Candidatus Thermoplasmatota archaeon]|nr:hypothetical protein [Candidatus Thermoplasmatota archaeon]
MLSSVAAGDELRNAMSSLFSWLSNTVSTIISLIFGAFRKMPVRVGLAIVGSICLTIAFAIGLLWGYIAPSLLSDDLKTTAQNSISVVLVMTLIWISISTFIPSLERQPEAVQADEEPVTEKTQNLPNPVVVVDEEETELVE